METVAFAFAKLNLTLDVLGRKDDGYHDMLMIMQGASLCDDLHIKACRGGGEIRISSGLPYVPSDGRNIAAKAAKLFCQRRGITGWDIDISVKKRIPVCAGLGGGSSDAAAVLRALNSMFGEKLTVSELREMSEELGSDVPYCVSFGTMRAEGRGEKLTELSPLPECDVVVCKPRFSVSTPALFAELDKHGLVWRPDTAAAESALEKGDIDGVAKNMSNVFEQVLGTRSGAIGTIKKRLIDSGALGAVMSGTGSAVFGIYDDAECARNAAELLSHRYDNVALCRSIGSIEI